MPHKPLQTYDRKMKRLVTASESKAVTAEGISNSNTPVTIVVGDFDNTRNWFEDYYRRSYHKMNSANELCQKAS